MLLGFYSSAQCVPVAAARRAAQEVHVDHHLHRLGGVRGPESQVRVPRRSRAAGQFGLMSTRLPRRERQGQARQGAQGPARRDHPRGRRLRRRRRRRATRRARKKAGFKIVLKEGYSATAPDLSPLVTKLKRARARRHLPHRLQPRHHAVPAPVARAGPAFSALIGHGAGYGDYDKLKETLGKDVNYFFNVDPISIWLDQREGAASPSCRR